jgi:hypothetical protein
MSWLSLEVGLAACVAFRSTDFSSELTLATLGVRGEVDHRVAIAENA